MYGIEGSLVIFSCEIVFLVSIGTYYYVMCAFKILGLEDLNFSSLRT